MSDCSEYELKIDESNSALIANSIKDFCNALKSNKHTESINKFLSLPTFVQCLFIKNCRDILWKRQQGDTSVSDKHVMIATRMYGLLSKIGKSMDPFVLKIINDFRVDTSVFRSIKSTYQLPKTEKVVYSKQFQKHATPDASDPLLRFYVSLYNEKPNSKLAIVWLVEHGVFDDQQRQDLLLRYSYIPRTK